jgi:hypothetical protein
MPASGSLSTPRAQRQPVGPLHSQVPPMYGQIMPSVVQALASAGGAAGQSDTFQQAQIELSQSHMRVP